MNHAWAARLPAWPEVTRHLAMQALVALGFLAAALLGMQLMLPDAHVPLVWPASGLALAAAYRLGNRALAGVAAGGLIIFSLTMQAPLAALAVTGATVAGAALGAWVLRRGAVDPALQSPTDVLVLLAALLVAGTVCSLLGALTLVYGGLVQVDSFQPLWWRCWVADTGGALLLAPALLTWGSAACSWRERFQWLALALAVAVLVVVAYSELVPPAAVGRPLSYLVFPLMIAAAVALRVRQVALLLLLHGAIALYYTAQLSGPFAFGGVYDSVLPLHSLLAMLSASMLLLAAAMTQQRRAQVELRQREAEYRLLVENQTDLLLKLDLEGRVRFASPSAAKVLGPAECQARVAGKLVHAVCAQRADPERAAKAALELEQPFATASGWRWINWLVKTVDDNGSGIAVIAVGRDVSDRHQAEQKARAHLEELARAGRIGAMGEMAAGLAHELNQPLCAINNYSNAVLRLLRAKDEPELREATERIAANATRAGGIMSQMRAFVRKGCPDRQLVNVNTLVQEVLPLTAGDARQHRVNLKLQLADPLPAVPAIPIQIQQVLLNLIRNGVEAITEAQSRRRQVLVRTRWNAVSEAVEISVRDTGPGLPTGRLEQAFEPFVTTKAHGIGLGLSISRSIVETHGGVLTASRPRGSGTEFRFTLPRRLPRKLRA